MRIALLSLYKILFSLFLRIFIIDAIKDNPANIDRADSANHIVVYACTEYVSKINWDNKIIENKMSVIKIILTIFDFLELLIFFISSDIW